VTINELAELAGVSIATVSKAINGRSDIGKATREKILTIMEENDYHPKMLAAGMDTIAVFAPMDRETHVDNPYFSGILAGVCDVIYERGYNLSVVSTKHMPKSSREFLMYCRQRKIVGGIFPLLMIGEDYFLEFADKFPMVVLSYHFDGAPIGCVGADNFGGGYIAARHLIDLGHEKIALVNPSTRYIDHNNRINGAKEAIVSAGLKLMPNSNSITSSLALNDADLSYMVSSIMSGTRPTAIFVASDQETMRTMRVLRDLKIDVPQNVSVVGFDDLRFAATMNPPLTTVRQPVFEIGKAACEMLAGAISSGKSFNSSPQVFKTELIVRKSTGAIAC
jgi:DNA-binding LacI/PurR family transcriptional regulator